MSTGIKGTTRQSPDLSCQPNGKCGILEQHMSVGVVAGLREGREGEEHPNNKGNIELARCQSPRKGFGHGAGQMTRWQMRWKRFGG